MLNHRRGFTLTELVVALSIASLVVYASVRVREGQRLSASTADCASNLRQIGLALLMYGEDYDQRLPQTWFDGDGDGRYTSNADKAVDGHSDYAWAYVLFAYTKSFQMFTCMSHPDDQNWDGRVAPAVDGDGISYGLNSRLGDVAWHLADITRPARTVAVCDLNQDFREPWVGLPVAGNDPRPGSIGNVAERVRDNHYSGRSWDETPPPGTVGYTVVGFCDGHVEALRKSTLLVSGDRNRWSPRH